MGLRGSVLLGSRCLSIQTRPPLSTYNTGQPTHETRPHYLPTPGNLTPGISALEYYTRRLELMKDLPPKSIAILQGNQVKYSSGSVFYDFQQDNDLFYLTGWLEPDSMAVLEKKGLEGDDVILHMLVPPKNPRMELWEGEKLGLQGAYDFFNADLVEDINKAPQYIDLLISLNDYIYWDDRLGKRNASKFSNFFNLGGKESKSGTIQTIIEKSNKTKIALSPLVAKQRSIKSEAEIQVMQAAGQISGRAINKAIAKVGSPSPLYTEKTLAKYLEYEFVKGGCDKQAYIPVVASGKNALTIHYTRNDDLLYRDEMVFIDAGGKLGGYCADISRTWPNSPNGFSEPQKDIYQVVLDVNKKCIELCDETKEMSVHDIHEHSVKLLTQGLKNLPGFAAVTPTDVVTTLYPHYIGHHLGLDLHDIPSISRFQKLVQGNVITIEPGLYIPQDDKWPKHYQGIGVRVEDDIVVGKNSDDILNLSAGCIKEVEDIEALISKGEVTTPGAHEELIILDI
ncbi:uncharacterized protein CANTADRAFT_52362 [Suhomyces tanzawaensis NRRL Y-17324]|uniref:Aminopeptidase P N-terminal domain-containing protein n=1 Tax=Suhomyces tanzawaensis NRRL Y-17324 TaxID=984487 RepID=A0A1E4SI95_9ASCO|nr:uncharacterized protein CANTADRAFT_52362 [Suhomyces tanzawaensis NRRL Y-17324]ODV79215.1 hypothetical protein CANTADRAFT_52362 [Suhomyces tanzawaensis NRRL Y-17324]